MRLTNKDLQSAYRRYNKAYFDDELPKDMCVEFSDDLDADTYGEQENGNILLSNDLRMVPDFAYIVLLHEMAHAKVPDNRNHGFQFGAIVTRLFQMGAYDQLL